MRYKNTFLILIASLILCFMGFYNNYPLVFHDTGAYISSGFKLTVLVDRPIFYGLFIRHISLHENLWLVIWAQGFILSILIYHWFKYFCESPLKYYFFITTIFILTFFTGASANVSTLMPDVFTPIFILSMSLLLFTKNIGTRDTIIISIILLFSLCTHNSHIVISLLLLSSYSILLIFKRVRNYVVKEKKLFFKKIILVWGIILLAPITVSTVHWSIDGDFKMSKGGHVFMLNRLIDMGILPDYLEKNCASKKYKICEYKDQIPWDFIWDTNSPLYKTGGWEANTSEYNAIIKDILTNPMYLKKFSIKVVESGFKQFFSFEAGDTPPLGSGTSPNYAINTFFKDQQKEYWSTKQCTGKLDYRFLNQFQTILIGISLLFLTILIISPIATKYKILIIFIISALFFNAIVTGGLSGVFPRYQSRVVWLIPMPLLIYIADSNAVKKVVGLLKNTTKNID